MSGGGKSDRKMRGNKAQGWEEAGAEFYQESYPYAAGTEWEQQRDPAGIATLLPSKQNRFGKAHFHSLYGPSTIHFPTLHVP